MSLLIPIRKQPILSSAIGHRPFTHHPTDAAAGGGTAVFLFCLVSAEGITDLWHDLKHIETEFDELVEEEVGNACGSLPLGQAEKKPVAARGRLSLRPFLRFLASPRLSCLLSAGLDNSPSWLTCFFRMPVVQG